jgi:hypothetical protein
MLDRLCVDMTKLVSVKSLGRDPVTRGRQSEKQYKITNTRLQTRDVQMLPYLVGLDSESNPSHPPSPDTDVPFIPLILFSLGPLQVFGDFLNLFFSPPLVSGDGLVSRATILVQATTLPMHALLGCSAAHQFSRTRTVK